VIRNIWIIHICPETDDVGELSPHSLIFPDGFLAFFDERLHAILFDGFLALDTDNLLDFDLDRKSVCVPTRFSRDKLPLHGMVARDHILDDAR